MVRRTKIMKKSIQIKRSFNNEFFYKDVPKQTETESDASGNVNGNENGAQQSNINGENSTSLGLMHRIIQTDYTSSIINTDPGLSNLNNMIIF